MWSKNDMDSGTQRILKEMGWSHLSLKSSVYQQPVLILNGNKRVSLNPKIMKAQWGVNCE
jgi:hypothetical protein